MKENPGTLGPWGSLVSLELREFLTPVQIRTGPLMWLLRVWVFSNYLDYSGRGLHWNNAVLNNITNTSFYVGKVEDLIDDFIDKNIDCIVVDPPRKGIEEKVLRSIINANIKKIIYVSCNPATLARDLGILKDYYEIQDISLVDMFCMTNGVESIATLSLKR